MPVLQLPDGSVIEESWDILRWALAAPDAQGWWARAQAPANLHLVERNDGDFKRHLDCWKYPQRYARGFGDLPSPSSCACAFRSH